MDDTDSRAKRIKELMLSSALGGGVMGSAFHALGRGATAASTLKSGGVGALLGAGLGGASGLVGDLIKGQPTQGEETPYAKRGAIGGLITGGALGALGGGLAASGKLGELLAAAPKARGLVEKALGHESVFMNPHENFILNKIKEHSLNPTAGKTAIGALIGASTLGTLAGLHGADEGMSADFLTKQKKSILKKRHDNLDGETQT